MGVEPESIRAMFIAQSPVDLIKKHIEFDIALIGHDHAKIVTKRHRHDRVETAALRAGEKSILKGDHPPQRLTEEIAQRYAYCRYGCVIPEDIKSHAPQ